jgi:Right handed beta helix region
MIKITSLQAIAGALLGCGLSAAPAQAGPNPTWVSGTGTDSGACTRAAPCKTFAFAITQTAAGGEIDVLDPADYGTVTIAKAISIVNDGVGVAAIGAANGHGVTINAGATDSVHLRGLTIDGLGTGKSGIHFEAGGNLAIENCVIRGFINAGINISPSTASSFSVSNTIASNNRLEGILVNPKSVLSGVLSKVTANNNFNGINVFGSSNVTIVDSEASHNGYIVFSVPSAGVLAQGTNTVVMVRNSVASYNVVGLYAGSSGSILRVAHSVVTGNYTGVNGFGGGIIQSYGDNDIDGNNNNNTGGLTVIPKH